MIKHYMRSLRIYLLLFLLAIGAFMVFNHSVKAQNATPTYRFRCSADAIIDTSDTGWQDYHANDSCSAQIGTGTGQVNVYVQFEKTENGQKTKTPIYIVNFNYMSTPVATVAPGGATATPVPTAAAGGATATPTPTPTPADAKASSTNRCPNLGTDTTLDVVPDCKLNSADGAKILKGIREHSGQ